MSKSCRICGCFNMITKLTPLENAKAHYFQCQVGCLPFPRNSSLAIEGNPHPSSTIGAFLRNFWFPFAVILLIKTAQRMAFLFFFFNFSSKGAKFSEILRLSADMKMFQRIYFTLYSLIGDF